MNRRVVLDVWIRECKGNLRDWKMGRLGWWCVCQFELRRVFKDLWNSGWKGTGVEVCFANINWRVVFECLEIGCKGIWSGDGVRFIILYKMTTILFQDLGCEMEGRNGI